MPEPVTQIDPNLNGHLRLRPSPMLDGAGSSEPKPWIRVPESDHQHRDAAAALAPLMHAACGWFAQGEAVVELNPERFALEVVTVDRSVTEFEKVCTFYSERIGRDNRTLKVPTKLTTQVARVLLYSKLMRVSLPQVRMLSRCPVLLARGGGLVGIVGFDRESGILVHPDARIPEDVPFENARDYLLATLVDFRPATDSDLSRIVAMLITPSLLRSGLLGDARGPIHIVEADESQTGKGYLVRTCASVYADTPHTITQRSGGVGSLDESIMAGLVAGHRFINIDNWRGPVNSPTLEAVLTEPRVECRVPYRGSVTVDPSPIAFTLTSNGAELTSDLARRANIIRLLKQPDCYTFKRWPEGSLLEHIRQLQPFYLGAVWSVVREWHRRGCPLAEDSRSHDFVVWSQAVRYIVRDMLGLADPFADYRAVQRAKSTPALTWIRFLLLAVKQENKLGLVLKAHDLWGLCVEHGIEVPGVPASEAASESDQTRTKALQGIGRRLKAAFGECDLIHVDGVPVHRIQRRIEAEKWDRAYIFGNVPEGPAGCGSGASQTQMELPV